MKKKFLYTKRDVLFLTGSFVIYFIHFDVHYCSVIIVLLHVLFILVRLVWAFTAMIVDAFYNVCNVSFLVCATFLLSWWFEPQVCANPCVTDVARMCVCKCIKYQSFVSTNVSVANVDFSTRPAQKFHLIGLFSERRHTCSDGHLDPQWD